MTNSVTRRMPPARSSRCTNPEARRPSDSGRAQSAPRPAPPDGQSEARRRGGALPAANQRRRELWYLHTVARRRAWTVIGSPGHVGCARGAVISKRCCVPAVTVLDPSALGLSKSPQPLPPLPAPGDGDRGSTASRGGRFIPENLGPRWLRAVREGSRRKGKRGGIRGGAARFERERRAAAAVRRL